jgi:hypothetical protein
MHYNAVVVVLNRCIGGTYRFRLQDRKVNRAKYQQKQKAS